LDSQSFWQLIGGIGLFLLGMSLMTDGLMSAGTRTMRSLVGRITRSRFAGLLTGFSVTALVQSSSATTLVTVGFVSAGVMTFHQSIAIMLGANVGTTSTAWIVSLVGFKMSSAAFALPAIGIGALIRLVSRGRRRALGLAIAGFGLVFLGIDFLQLGMGEVARHIRPEDIALDGFLGRLALVGIGLVMTVVMQSSSAASATTLAAVNAGSISFEQAAALVIGQNIGTTVTAIIGAIGGTLAARRAAVAHVFFNVGTGVLALVALVPFTHLVAEIGEDLFEGTKEGYVALFHTAFNVLGVAIFLPMLSPFARFVQRMVPERSDSATQRLSAMTLTTPALALEAARLTTMELGQRAIRSVIGILAHHSRHAPPPTNLIARAARMVRTPGRILTGEEPEARALASGLDATANGLVALRGFLSKIGRLDPRVDAYREYLAILYASDHVQRLLDDIRDEERLNSIALDPTLSLRIAALEHALLPLANELAFRADASVPAASEADDLRLAEQIDGLRALGERERLSYRSDLLQRTVKGELTPADADELLDTNRWLFDIGHAATRIAEFLVWPHTAARELEGAPAPAGRERRPQTRGDLPVIK
jgi:phosphate:Na+ symporter